MMLSCRKDQLLVTLYRRHGPVHSALTPPKQTCVCVHRAGLATSRWRECRLHTLALTGEPAFTPLPNAALA